MAKDQYVRISVSWPDEQLLERVKAAAAVEERSLSQWVVRTVRQHFERIDAEIKSVGHAPKEAAERSGQHNPGFSSDPAVVRARQQIVHSSIDRIRAREAALKSSGVRRTVPKPEQV